MSLTTYCTLGLSGCLIWRRLLGGVEFLKGWLSLQNDVLGNQLANLWWNACCLEVNTSVIQRQAKHLNGVLNHFWKRWSKEYLLELRESHRHSSTSGALPEISVGDMLVAHIEDHHRGFWKLAWIERLITGRDGHTQGAVLRLPAKKWWCCNGHYSCCILWKSSTSLNYWIKIHLLSWTFKQKSRMDSHRSTQRAHIPEDL